MSHTKIFGLVLLCVVVSSGFALSPVQRHGPNSTQKLSLLEKIALYTVAKTSPHRRHHGFPMEEVLLGGLFKPPTTVSTEFNLFFGDVLVLLDLVRSVSPGASLPELDYYYYFSFGLCPGFFCWNLDITINSGNTIFKGQEEFSSEWVVSPTRFEFRFKVPSFKWSSPGFNLNISDRDYQTHHINRDFHLDILNGEMILSADYAQVDNVGLVVSNLNVSTSVDVLETTLETSDTYDFFGNLLGKYGPLNTDFTAMVEFLEANFGGIAGAEMLQMHINCVLTNTRYDSEGCEKLWDFGKYERHRKMHAVALIQSAILASMTRP